MGGLNSAEKKSIIGNKINQAYIIYGKSCKSKDELKETIENSLSIEEKNYLKEKEIQQYFDEQLVFLWDKKEKDIKEVIDENLLMKTIQITYDEAIARLLTEHQDEIILMESQRKQFEEESIKENQKKFENQLNEFKEKIKKMEEKAENERKKNENKQKTLEEDFQKKIKLLQKKYQDEKDEEKRKIIEKKKLALEERKKKIEENNKEFSIRLEKLKKTKINEIINSIKQDEKNFCKKEISSFDKGKITSLIRAFLANEKVPEYIVKNLKIKAENAKKKIDKNVEHLNIVLLGPSGVGKSTLVNAMLDLDSNQKSETCFGKPMSKDFEIFESKNIPFLRLFDSRGIEKSEKYGVEAFSENIKNFIKSKIKEKDCDKYIHCIWYCWTGARLEECEIDVLKQLSEQYTLDSLPIIIVYTKAIDNDDIENAKKFISEDLKLNNVFIEVLAKTKNIKIDNEVKAIKPYNLDLLRNKSIELAKNAIQSSCYQGLITEIQDNIENSFNELKKKLKENINEDIYNFIKNLDEKCDMEDIYNKNINIILNILYRYFLLDPTVCIKSNENPEVKFRNIDFSFGKTSQAKIKDFIEDYFKECLTGLDYNMNEIIEKKTDNIYNEILIFKNEFISMKGNLLENYMTNIEYKYILKNEIKNGIYNIAKLAMLKNSFNFISEPLIERFGNYFIELYNSGIKHKKFISYARDIIKIDFEKIEQKIKEYNESMKNKNEDINYDPAPQNLTKNSIREDVKDILDNIY